MCIVLASASQRNTERPRTFEGRYISPADSVDRYGSGFREAATRAGGEKTQATHGSRDAGPVQLGRPINITRNYQPQLCDSVHQNRASFECRIVWQPQEKSCG